MDLVWLVLLRLACNPWRRHGLTIRLHAAWGFSLGVRHGDAGQPRYSVIAMYKPTSLPSQPRRLYIEGVPSAALLYGGPRLL